MSSVHTALTFKGDIDTISDLPKTANLGDVWRVNKTDNVYVYMGTDWVCIATSDTQSSSDTHASRDCEPEAQTCTQCGGVLESDEYGRLSCPYCGTLYR